MVAAHDTPQQKYVLFSLFVGLTLQNKTILMLKR